MASSDPRASGRRSRRGPEAPGIGDPARELVLSTPFGIEVNLRECLLRGPALVEFIRGTWDPNARERISLLDAARPRLDERAVRVLVVACEREDSARRYLEANPSPLSLLLDAEGAVARSWGVFERFSFGAFRVARPASFVVDRCGFVRFAHVGRSPIDAAPLDAVEGVLAALEREVRAT